MSLDLPASVPHVVHVEVMRGAEADPAGAPSLLVEVPHGADERRHYDALFAELRGAYPIDLVHFFHVNTDVGAWAYGRATAERVLAARPTCSALLLRSEIPRTFIDCNRPATFKGAENGDPTALTPGVPVYVTDDADLELLLDRHRRYCAVADAAFELVCGGGGVALVPHTYAPRHVPIESVDETIVEQLHAAYVPERFETFTLRAEVDLLTRDGEGREFSPEGIEADLMEAFAAAGYDPRANDTYYLHPAALAHGRSVAHPGRVLCLELRRDLVVERWDPFVEMRADPAKVARIAEVLAPALASRLG